MTETIQLTILHSNDMHGHLVEMARLSTFVRQQRAALEAAGRQVLFVDCGDAADRSQRFCGVTKGSVFPPILAAMGVQMQALGNDISVTYGPQAAAQMAQNSPFPVLAANFYRDGQPLLPGFERWQIWPVSQAVSVGVIGLTVNTLGFYRLFGLDVPDFTSTTRETFAELSLQIHGPVIVLSHLGLQDDLELARTMPELAVIIGGHSHTLLEQGQWEGSVLVAQAGEYAASVVEHFRGLAVQQFGGASDDAAVGDRDRLKAQADPEDRQARLPTQRETYRAGQDQQASGFVIAALDKCRDESADGRCPQCSEGPQRGRAPE